jgi:hypothetical protein
MYAWLPPDVELVTDPSPGDWVVAAMRPRDPEGIRVGSFMPDVFDAYARILHPAGGRGGADAGLRWSDVASMLSKPFHDEVQFIDLVDGARYEHPLLGDIEPLSGSLPLHVLNSLTAFLGRWTDVGEHCWFAMWEGNGAWWSGAHYGDTTFDVERDLVLRAMPRLGSPHDRRYFLMRGPLRAMSALFDAAASQSPALWWPESRRWLVSTEVDAYSSYVGGPSELITSLLGYDDIEALPSRLDAPLDWGN